jgi:arylsulfatase A-like enzyme
LEDYRNQPINQNERMKRTLLLLFAGIFLCSSASAQSPTRKPNILLIVADDLGYAELGCQGGQDILTPNIDSLAKNGVRCTSGYVSCPVCSPTRAGLMTGRYQQRFGHELNPGAPALASTEFGLPLSEVTLADRLKAGGYVTGMVGKWHLGLKPKFHPLQRGFDEYFGFLHGSHSYVDAKGDQQNPIWRGTNRVDEPEYLTDAFTREALAFVERHKKETFFLYLTYNAVHSPMQVPDKYKNRFPSIKDERRRTFAGMLSALDDGVGDVLKKIRDADLEENTLIFFISDNGGPTPNTTSGNGPLRGYKAQVWEGGIRVPFIVQWKGHLPSGKVYDQPVISLDIHPTALAAGGIKPPVDAKLDGLDLMPYLAGNKTGAPHDALFWRFGAQSAVRKGNFKLVKLNQSAPQLFDLAADIGEKNDLASQKADVAKSLETTLKQWDSQLAKPLWSGGNAGKKKKKKA